MDKLYKFYWDCGSNGDLEGVFVEDEEMISKIIGFKVYFSGVLGKHSEICDELKEEDFTVLTDNQTFIAQAIEYGLVPTGTNPMDYIDKYDLEEYLHDKRLDEA